MLRANPEMPVKEIVSALAKRGLKVTDNLVYFIKGRLKGKRGRRKKTGQLVANVVPTSDTSPLATILRVKSCANEVGGLKKLKALVDALIE